MLPPGVVGCEKVFCCWSIVNMKRRMYAPLSPARRSELEAAACNEVRAPATDRQFGLTPCPSVRKQCTITLMPPAEAWCRGVGDRGWCRAWPGATRGTDGDTTRSCEELAHIRKARFSSPAARASARRTRSDCQAPMGHEDQRGQREQRFTVRSLRHPHPAQRAVARQLTYGLLFPGDVKPPTCWTTQNQPTFRPRLRNYPFGGGEAGPRCVQTWSSYRCMDTVGVVPTEAGACDTTLSVVWRASLNAAGAGAGDSPLGNLTLPASTTLAAARTALQSSFPTLVADRYLYVERRGSSAREGVLGADAEEQMCVSELHPTIYLCPAVVQSPDVRLMVSSGSA